MKINFSLTGEAVRFILNHRNGHIYYHNTRDFSLATLRGLKKMDLVKSGQMEDVWWLTTYGEALAPIIDNALSNGAIENLAAR
jgi:hypothetical protein